jgi:hypothetical protein
MLEVVETFHVEVTLVALECRVGNECGLHLGLAKGGVFRRH